MKGAAHSRRHWLAGAASLAMPARWGARARAESPAGPAGEPLASPDPAFPPAALHRAEAWDDPAFRDVFLPARSPTRIVHKVWPRPVTAFGIEPHGVFARCRDDEIECLTLLFLDAGTHFGYIPKARAGQTARQHRESFQRLSSRIASSVRDGLAGLANHPGSPHELGREPMLVQPVSLFPTGNLWARLHLIGEQLVKVAFFRDEPASRHWIDPAERDRPPRERGAALARAVSRLPNGDVLLPEVPLLLQGDRAYCGVSALAKAMQSLGLWIDTEDYAAAAGIRYGSTQGSHIKEVYEAAAAEAGLRLARSARLSYEEAIASIDAGFPAVVWRRWSPERDYLHAQFLKKLSRDPEARLPEPDAADRSTWPGTSGYNHASVITGYNTERKELLFSESWGESVRNRRMRREEMEGTTYHAFRFLHG